MNRGQLREEIARMLNVWVDRGAVAASPAPTASAFGVAAFATRTPAELVGKLLAMSSGTRIGQEQFIYSFDNSDQETVLRAALTGAPAAADTLEVYSAIGYTRINQAITNAINGARHHFLVAQTDQSITLVAATYEYTAPSGFAYISTINLEYETNKLGMALPDDSWELTNVSGVAKLRIRHDWILNYTSKRLELRGQAYPTAPSADATANPIPDAYVLAWACFFLGAEMPLGQSDAGWRDRLNAWRQTTLDMIKTDAVPPFPGAKRVR